VIEKTSVLVVGYDQQRRIPVFSTPDGVVNVGDELFAGSYVPNGMLVIRLRQETLKSL
jgi:hypothetical protein